jgi:CheY-like chemotaxis protein
VGGWAHQFLLFSVCCCFSVFRPVMDGLTATTQIRLAEAELNKREAAQALPAAVSVAAALGAAGAAATSAHHDTAQFQAAAATAASASHPAGSPGVSSSGVATASSSPDALKQLSPMPMSQSGVSSAAQSSSLPVGSPPLGPPITMGDSSGRWPQVDAQGRPLSSSPLAPPSAGGAVGQPLAALLSAPAATAMVLEPMSSSGSSSGASATDARPTPVEGGAAGAVAGTSGGGGGSAGTAGSSARGSHSGEHGSKNAASGAITPVQRHIPIIACTASVMDSDAEICRKVGMDGEWSTHLLELRLVSLWHWMHGSLLVWLFFLLSFLRRCADEARIDHGVESKIARRVTEMAASSKSRADGGVWLVVFFVVRRTPSEGCADQHRQRQFKQQQSARCVVWSATIQPQLVCRTGSGQQPWLQQRWRRILWREWRERCGWWR